MIILITFNHIYSNKDKGYKNNFKRKFANILYYYLKSQKKTIYILSSGSLKYWDWSQSGKESHLNFLDWKACILHFYFPLYKASVWRDRNGFFVEYFLSFPTLLWSFPFLFPGPAYGSLETMVLLRSSYNSLVIFRLYLPQTHRFITQCEGKF